jgi:hypothetical protein
LFVLCLSIWSLASCGSSSQPSASACDPNSAPEVLAVTVQNAGQEHLQNYAVAVPLDATTFDFAIPAPDGSDLAAWDEFSNQPLPHWLESYNPAGQKKGLLWVKIPVLAPQSSRRFLLTGGSAKGCSNVTGSGYSIFPFFSDVNDVLNWHATDQLSVTGDVAVGPLPVTRRSVIQSDGAYNGFPGIVQAANGDFVLSYTKGSSHVSGPFVVVRRSQDGGMSWSPEVVFFNTSMPDPALARSPEGALLVGLGKLDQNGDEGGAYSRSTDNGLTWGPFTFFDQPVSDSIVVAPLLNVGQTMYAAGYGPYAGGMGDTPSLWSSVDDGLSWTKLSQLREPGDPGLNETAIAQTGPNSLFAMMRTDDGLDTFGRYSDDMGLTWGALRSYTTQVRVLQAPQLIQAGSALLLLGRENIASLTMPTLSSTVFPHSCMHSEKSAISLSLKMLLCRTNQGSLVIGFRSGTQSDPCISSVTTSIMITTSDSPVKGSGIPNQFLGVLLHTMAMSGLSRVSVWACGPPKLMKISSSQVQNRTGSERRD